MTTIAIYFAALCLLIAITLVIPGLSTIITPVWAGVGKGILMMVSWSFGWCVYVIKGVYGAHIEVARHMVLSEETVDIRKRVKK